MIVRRAVLISRLLLCAGAAFYPALVSAASGASGGLTLIEAPGARSAALGEAFSTMPNDVTAMAYNPATLQTLSSSQVSLSYESGLSDDAYGRVGAGFPGIGVSAAYYSAGKADLLENGVTRSVNAQTDLALSAGGAVKLGGASFGAAGKYLSSVLAETNRASAWAGDAGLLAPIGPVTFGVAVQNIGSRIKFIDAGDPLPRIARAGLSIPFSIRTLRVRFLAEAPYFLNEREWRPAGGAEVSAGPIAFRAGYRSGSRLEGLTVGAGFALGSLTLDYAFGFVDSLNARQRVSLGFRFGSRSKDSSGVPFDDTAYQRRRSARTAASGKKTAPAPDRPRIGGHP